MTFQPLSFTERWQKKFKKWKRRLGHYKNVYKKTTANRHEFFKFLFRKIIKPFRIFIGTGGIKGFDKPLDVLFQSEDFIVINKPADILTHPTHKNEPDTLLNALLFHLGMTGNKHINMPGPVSRLDRDTSGAVMFGISKKAKQELGQTMTEQGFTKKYTALVVGKIETAGEIKKGLLKIHRERLMQINDKKGKFAHTKYAPLEYFSKENVSLIEVEILTGRMHQIRAHMNFLGHPIIGDILYGIPEQNEIFFKKGLERQFLHCSFLSFQSDILGTHEFIAPLSEDLQQLLTVLRA